MSAARSPSSLYGSPRCALSFIRKVGYPSWVLWCRRDRISRRISLSSTLYRLLVVPSPIQASMSSNMVSESVKRITGFFRSLQSLRAIYPPPNSDRREVEPSGSRPILAISGPSLSSTKTPAHIAPFASTEPSEAAMWNVLGAIFSSPDSVPELYRRSKGDWERRGSSLGSSDLMAARSVSIAVVEGASADFAIQHSVYTECDTSLSVPSCHHPRCRYALPFSRTISRPCFLRVFSLRELEGRAGVSTTQHLAARAASASLSVRSDKVMTRGVDVRVSAFISGSWDQKILSPRCAFAKKYGAATIVLPIKSWACPSFCAALSTFHEKQ